MSATEKVVNDLNVSKLMLCNPKMLTSEMFVRIGQAINGAIDLLKEQEPVEPTYEDFFGKGVARCGKCSCYIARYKYCPRCGQEVKWND